MYKVLLVDDEAHIRYGIAEGIDWPSLGLRLEAMAANGREALRLAETVRPDLILFDIQMPYMNGLEFAKHARRMLPDCIMIVFTGYEQFDYAQEAIRLGVKEYLLKPVSPRELTEALEAAAREITERKEKETFIANLHQQVEASVPLIREKAIRDYVHRSISVRELRSQEAFLQLSWPSDKFFSVVVRLNGYLKGADQVRDVQLTLFAVKNIMEELIEDFGCGVCYIENDSLIEAMICLNPEAAVRLQEPLNEQARHLSERIGDKLEEYLKIGVAAAAGKVYLGLEQLPFSYREALSGAMRPHSDRLNAESEVWLGGEDAGEGDWEYPPDKEQALLQALQSGDSAVYRLADSLMAAVGERPPEAQRQAARQLAERIYETATHLLDRLGIEGDLPVSPACSPIPEEMPESDWLAALTKEVQRFIGQCADLAVKSQGPTYRHEIEKVKSVIDRRYHEPLKLKDLAESVYMNPNYLCTVFRSEVGESIHQYVTRIRMERAKLLLSVSTLKIFEVAEQTGYSSTQYFSHAFKKYAGMSPVEYRESQTRP